MWRTNQVKILRDIRIIATCLILGTGLFACKSSATPQEPANTAMPAATNTVAPSATLLPTDTPTLEPTTTPLPTDTPTLEPTATPDLTATAAIKATQAAEEAMAIVSKDLDLVGMNSDDGKLVWFSPEAVTMKVTSYGSLKYQLIDPDLVVQDFVYQTEVTWESSGGLAACGLIFRAEEDIDRGAQYRFGAIRLSGLPMWNVYRIEYNTLQDDMSAKYPFSSAINQKQGGTNIYTLIAQGNKFTFYANGDRLGTVFNSKISEGRIGYFTSQESGETSCTFENTWLFVLNQP